jgi:hypothetical protein
MEGIMHTALRGDELSADHYSSFNVMIRERLGRRLWAKFVASYKAGVG